MKALDRKMLRDLWGLKGQAAAITFVIIGGVATFVAMRSTVEALQFTLSSYYGDYRFADVFATVRRAPERVADRLRSVSGVNQVETRVSASVKLDVTGFDEPVSGLVVSIPGSRQPALNQLFVREGRLVEPGHENEVLLNETFAEAHGLRPGDELSVIVNGRRRTLSVVGIALSPEFLMQIQPGTLFPDPQRFGVLWMARDALAAAYDMAGGFNDVAIALAPGADLEDVLDRVDDILRPYGGQGAYGRSEQTSHFTITQEFSQLEGMATMLPVIFLGVAAFLLNIVVTRLISMQREQIAVLKAFGYGNLDVGLHYLQLVLVVALIGAAAGTAVGAWMGHGLGALYMQYYRFPYLEFSLKADTVLSAAFLTTGAAVVGVVRAVRRAVKLPPAEAMRPEPPASYRPTLIERMGMQRFFDQPTRMIARNLERQPVRALLTIIGIACSCAILIMGLYFGDAFDYIVRIQYNISQRDDLTVTFTQPTSTDALYELRSLPGVHHAEAFRIVPVRLRYGPASYTAGIEGLPEDAYLRRVVDADIRPIEIPEEGILLTERLAHVLRAEPGDEIEVEVLEGSRRTRTVRVVARTEQYIGIGAYMNLNALNRLVGGGQAISGAYLTTDRNAEDAVVDALQRRPRIAGITAQQRAIEAFMETTAQTTLVFTFILSLFAGVIAFGVVYNSARIALSERDRELASLRVLGFTRGEVAYILLGEMAVLVLVAIPIGLGLGALGSAGAVEGLQTDLYQIPLIFSSRTFSLAAVIVLVSAVLSALMVRRSLNRLDLVGVLKTRE